MFLGDELIKAIQQNDEEKVKQLIPLCTDILDSFIDVDDTTILFNAVYYRNKSIIKALLEAGANPMISDHLGNTPFSFAKFCCDDSIINLIQEHINRKEGKMHDNSHDSSKLIEAINDRTFNNISEFKQLIEEHVDEIDWQDEEGFTALHLAVYDENSDMIKILLDAGADSTIKDNLGRTALDIAIEFKEEENEFNEFEYMIDIFKEHESKQNPVEEETEPKSKPFFARFIDSAQRAAIAGSVNATTNLLINKIVNKLSNPELLKLIGGKIGLKFLIGICLMGLLEHYPDKVPQPEIVEQCSTLLLEASAEEGIEKVIDSVIIPAVQEFAVLAASENEEQKLLESEPAEK